MYRIIIDIILYSFEYFNRFMDIIIDKFIEKIIKIYIFLA